MKPLTILFAFAAFIAVPTLADTRGTPPEFGITVPTVSPDDLPVRKCVPHGRTEADAAFLVVDSQQGESFSVEILYQIAPPHAVNVHWSAQIPRTKEGVTTYFQRDDGAWEFHDFENGLGGGCGQTVGQARESSTYTVQVDFGGMDVETSSKHGYTHTRSITLGVEGTFNIGVGTGFTGGSITVKYDDTNTWTIADEFTATTHGYKKTFLQEYPNDLASPRLWGCKAVLCKEVL